MDALRILGLSLIVVCFVFFIAIRAIKTHNYIRKAVFLSFVGLGLLMFFFGGLIFDVINSQLDSYVNYYGFAYYIPPLVVIVFTILIFILYFSKGYKYHQKFRMVYKKEKSEITIRDKKQYIYLLLSYKNQMLLKIETTKTGDKNYSNIIVKFPRNEFFYDEYIKKIIKKMQLETEDYKLLGTATHHGKVDDIYYCYRINLISLTDELRNFEMLDAQALVNKKLSDFDRKIIYTSFIEKDFSIEV